MKKFKLLKIFCIAIALVIVAAVFVKIGNKNRVDVKLAEHNVETAFDKMNTTGDTARFAWRGGIRSNEDKFAKNGYVSYNIYCAEHNGSIGSSGATYTEVLWDSEAGIWKDEDAFRKLDWILNNLFEKVGEEGYTNEEKLFILNKADATITLEDVTNVFGDETSRFVLFQNIVWTYSKNIGSDSVIGKDFRASERKIYNAIVALANENYQTEYRKSLTVTKTDGDEGHYDEANHAYIWKITIDNSSPLDYTLDVKVDGTSTDNYTYQDGVLTINGIEAGNHSFSAGARVYQVDNDASVWYNATHQKFIEITKTERFELSDEVSTSVSATGKFNLNIVKVDPADQPVSGATFKVNNVELENPTDTNGQVSIEAGKDIASQKENYTYTISEIDSGNNLSKLKNPVTVRLSSGLRKTSNDGYYYAINKAVFSNGSTTYRAISDNGTQITLRIQTSYSDADGTTTITVTIPNAYKKYDLALTKTMCLSASEVLDVYDVNRDGSINGSDATFIEILKERLNNLNNDTDFKYENYNKMFFNDAMVPLETYNTYYKYLIDESLPADNDLRYKGIYDRIKQFIVDINGIDEEPINSNSFARAKENLLRIAASIGARSDIDRINSVNDYPLKNDSSKTAIYNMNKVTRKVDKNDIIIYKITVYNEGEYDGKDIEITDYLPEGLIICDESGNTELTGGKITYTRGGNSYEWTVDGRKVSTTIDGTLGKYNSDTGLQSANVFIACKIDPSVNVGTILYNVAEISNSTPVNDNDEPIDVVDRDSHEDSIEDNTENDVIDKYKERFEEKENDEFDADDVNKDLYHYEDDDDFERIEIVEKEFDLSLRKSITKVGNSENRMVNVPGTGTSDEGEQNAANRLPKLTERSADVCLNKGTAEYYHGKHYVNVKKDDYVEYTLRVYNEGRDGDYNGYASQIKDYLPESLEFAAVVDCDGSWVSTQTSGKYVTTANNLGHYEVTYDSANNQVTIDCIDTPILKVRNGLKDIASFKDSNMQTYYNIGDSAVSEVVYGYQEVRIICKVKNTAPVLTHITNIAEITADVAKNGENEEVDIDDRDSHPGLTKEETPTSDIDLDSYYQGRRVNDAYRTYYPGNEDDDDFETVYIEPSYEPTSYDLMIRKVDQDGKALNNAAFSLKSSESQSTNLLPNSGVVGNDGYTGTYTEQISQGEVETKYSRGETSFAIDYTLTETTVPTGYVKIKNSINCQYNINIAENNGVVSAGISTIVVTADSNKSVTFNYASDLGATKTINDVLLNDDTTANVSITLDNNGKITIVVPNKENFSGTFDINLIKTIKGEQDPNDSTKQKPLPGAKFRITVSDGTNTLYDSDTVAPDGLVTGSNGRIPAISGLNIADSGITYTITIQEKSAPEGYIGLGADNVYTLIATSQTVGTSYQLVPQSKTAIQNDSNIAATVTANEVLIEAENRVEPVIHKGVKTVENQSSGYDKNEIQTWVINSTIPAGIDTFTYYAITDEIDPDKSTVSEKRINFINEEHPEQNVLVKYKGTDTTLRANTDYKVDFNRDTKVLKITFIDSANSFVGGRSLTEKTTLEITFKTQFALANGEVIGVNQSIPNQAELKFGVKEGVTTTKQSEKPEVHTGELRIFKYDKDTNTALSGAHFKLTKTEAEANRAVQAILSGDTETLATIDFVKAIDANGDITTTDLEAITGTDGKAAFKGLEFGEDAQGKVQPSADPTTGASVYRYNWEEVSTKYYIVETQVPADYILLDHFVEAEVKYGEISEADLTGYHKIGNDKITYEGTYNVQIIKYGVNEGSNPTPIAGVKFNADRTVNGLAKETLTVANTDGRGITAVGDTVTIANDKVSETDIDIYNITEVSVPADSEYYVGLDKTIKLSIAKQATENTEGTHIVNSVKSITMEIEGVDVTRVSDTKSTATITKDGQQLVVTAQLVDNTITLTMQNPHKVGAFDLDIVKLLKGSNPKQYLAGAGFKVSVKTGNDYVTDGDGNTLDGTHEYFVGTQGDSKGRLSIDGIDIKKAGTVYSFEIEESTVPSGYIGISDKITFTATSKVYNNKLGLTTGEIEISNDVVATVGENDILVEVNNKPEPEIHKGVKAVDNMDSGYDKDEIHTWIINSTIPTGIADYTQYIITDEIDPDKSNVDEKRIEYVDDSVVVKIKGTDTVLTEGTDYKVDFDNDNKILKITFIDIADGVDFEGGRGLTENTTLEITFNTKFRLDSDGNIIGINQSIPNQAELEFGVKPDETKKKQSEKPEVHTGGVGVFKYDEKTNKALEGAHFVITKNKTLADRAAKAVLDGNTEELNRLLASNDFVKVGDTNVNLEAITGKDGHGKFEGLEFGEDAMNTVRTKTRDSITGAEVYKYDWTKAQTKYYVVETVVPKGYKALDAAYEVIVKYDNYDELDLTKYYEVVNTPKIYDLSLRKFITKVNDKDITDREPKVTLTDDFKSGKVTTAEYNHTKNPLVVQQDNIVTYTIRVYNEGPEDAYASKIMDDIPDGLELVASEFDKDGKATNTNAEYRWVAYREMTSDEEAIPDDMIIYNKKSYIVEKDVKKADLIVTDYLSIENGEEDTNGINQNLLKGYDKDTMSELDYRDIKVQFKVTEPNTSERILTNYAQISEMTDDNGDNDIDDRDSTPNEWIEDEDDQDIENIKLLYFDLELRKWVTKAIVTENGKTVVTETGHHAEDDPEDVVKVDLKKSKVNSVVVKFEYQIRITNKGKIGGWCDEIKDHIPNGLRFEQADNPTWTQLDEKTIVTDALKNTYLEHDESAEVTVVLTWENSGTNLGIKTNIAEISKDRNDYGVHDIDSTPDNYIWGEDDIDDAPVMLTLRTGNQVIVYVAIIAGMAVIIGLGVYYIRKIER